MSLSTYYLVYGRHLVRLHRRCRRHAYTPTSNAASHDNHEKITLWVSFKWLWSSTWWSFGPLELRYRHVRMQLHLLSLSSLSTYKQSCENANTLAQPLLPLCFQSCENATTLAQPLLPLCLQSCENATILAQPLLPLHLQS